MGKKKDVKIILDTYGNYLGMEKGCIVLRDKERNETRYPLIENTVSEIVLNSGNMVSTGLLCSMGFWGTDVLISTRNGKRARAILYRMFYTSDKVLAYLSITFPP